MTISITGSAHTAIGQNVTSVTTASWTSSAGCVLLALVTDYLSNNSTAPTITDSKSNTWTQVGSTKNVPSTTTVHISAWVCIPSSVGTTHTVTATRGAAVYCDIDLCVLEFANADTTTPIDTAALSAASSGTSTAPSNTTGTLSQADECIAGIVGWFSTATMTEASGFTNKANLTDGSDNVKSWVSTQIVSATTAITFNPTLSASTNWACLAVPVKGAAAGGGGFFSRYYYDAHVGGPNV